MKTLGRGGFALEVSALLGLATVVDAVIATRFGQAWSPLVYFSPRACPRSDLAGDPTYASALLALGLLFTAALVWLARRRLADLGAPPVLGLLVAVPYAQVAFVLLLAIAPRGWPLRFFLAVGLGVAIAGLAFAIVLVAPRNGSHPPFEDQAALGVGLFLGAPIVIGFWSAYIVSWRETDASFRSAVEAALTSLALGLALLMALAFEGVACIVMSAPILATGTFAGAALGHFAARLPRSEWTNGDAEACARPAECRPGWPS
jgi:hypothetical protein